MTRYLILFALVTAIMSAMLIPLHSLPAANIMLLTKYPESKGKILLFGNSVNGATSKCDKDTRQLPEMAIKEGLPIVNISRGGMTLGEMLQLAENGVKTGILPSTMIFPISPEAGFFQSVAAPHGFDDFIEDNLANLPWMGNSGAASQPVPLAYKGKHYGTYGEFAKKQFVREKSGVTCPETRGVDHAFEQFMYWRNYLQLKDPLIGLNDLLPRINKLKKKNVRVVFWMMPVNYGDLLALHDQFAIDTVQQEVAQVRAALEQHGFTVVDSSKLVPASGFTDRWCACGHMSETGRKTATVSLSAHLNSKNIGKLDTLTSLTRP